MMHRMAFIVVCIYACTPPARHRPGIVQETGNSQGAETPKSAEGTAVETEQTQAPAPTQSPPAPAKPKTLAFGPQSCEKNPATNACYVVDASLNEMSGIVASPQAGNLFWVHDDEGPGILYAINLRGEIVSRLTLPGITFLDSEDITLGPGPKAGVSYLYLGDIGDSANTPGSVRVLRMPEPVLDPNQKGSSLTAQDVVALTLTYGGRLQDFETMFIDPVDGDLFLVQKAGYNVYKASKALLDAAPNGGSVPLALVRSSGAWAMEPSSGNMSPSGDEIVLRNETTAWLFRRSPGQKVEDALGIIALTLTLGPEFNGEAITFDAKGLDLLTVSENTSKNAPAPSPPQPVSMYRRLPAP